MAERTTTSGHIVPPSVLLTVCLSLLGLTFLTVAATWVELGVLSLWVALGIATLKASLVALYFMHLRYDAPFNGLVLIAALVFVTLFVSLSLMDTVHYQPDVRWEQAPALQRG